MPYHGRGIGPAGRPLNEYQRKRGDRVGLHWRIPAQKTGRPVQFEMTEQTREAVLSWIRLRGLCQGDYLFPSRIRASRHLSTRQYARILQGWVSLIGLNPRDYGTHSLRRTKATRSTAARRTCGPFSCCSVMQTSKALSTT